VTATAPLEIQIWPIDRLILYARNPRKNDAAVDRMCSSIREFGFKIPVLARSDGEVVDGHLRIKAARKLGITEVPLILCDEWTPAQVKAFRLLVNRSVTWAVWDEELLALELQELSEADFDLDLTGFNPGEIDGLLAIPDEERANAAPPVPENPVSRPGDLWLCGLHRVLCGDATSAEAVARLLGDRQPLLMVTDPPYGIELDSEWRDRAGLNGGDFGIKRTRASKARAAVDPQYHAEPSYMKQRTEGHTETSISGDTRADWSDAFELVPSLQIAYVWYVRKKNAAWFGKAGENATIWDSPSPKFIMGGSDETKFDHPTQKPVDLMLRPILNHLKRGEAVYDPFLGSGTTLAAAELTERVCCGIELDPKYVDVIVGRWEQLSGKKATLEADGRNFEEIANDRRRAA
jgi:DNA modification methylase